MVGKIRRLEDFWRIGLGPVEMGSVAPSSRLGLSVTPYAPCDEERDCACQLCQRAQVALLGAFDGGGGVSRPAYAGLKECTRRSSAAGRGRNWYEVAERDVARFPTNHAVWVTRGVRRSCVHLGGRGGVYGLGRFAG